MTSLVDNLTKLGNFLSGSWLFLLFMDGIQYWNFNVIKIPITILLVSLLSCILYLIILISHRLRIFWEYFFESMGEQVRLFKFFVCQIDACWKIYYEMEIYVYTNLINENNFMVKDTRFLCNLQIYRLLAGLWLKLIDLVEEKYQLVIKLLSVCCKKLWSL